MITLPDAFVAAVVRSGGEDGRRWLADLPRLIAALCTHWDLLADGAAMHGHLSLVLPVRRGSEQAVLKVSWATEHTEFEARALAAWSGRGAVCLLEADPTRGALLLERLDSGRSLSFLDLDEAAPIVGRLLRRLAIPAPPGFPRLADIAARFADDLPARWDRAGRPFRHSLLDRTRALARELGPTAGDLLVHWDLHYENVLAGAREPWLAIDPLVVSGDPEYGVAPPLLRGLDRMAGRTDLHRHLTTLVEAAELDRERARGWATVRLVDYWLWALSIGLTEDPVRCATIIDWL